MTGATDRNGTTHQPWTLKMLSGLHAGAEAVLSNEKATIGSKDDCDLVLEDANLREHHIRLCVSDTGVRLEVLEPDNPVCIDGRQVGEDAELEPYQVVSIGHSSFAMGPAGEEWPHIELPFPPSTGKRAPADQARTGEEPHGTLTGDEAAGTDNETGNSRALPPGRLRTRLRPSMPRAASMSVALIAATVALWVLSPKELEEGHGIPIDATDQIMAIAMRHGAVLRVESRGDDGRYALTGSIDTAHNRRRFLADLADTGILATAHITSSEELARVVLPILDQTLNYDRRNQVTVRPVDKSPGTLEVAGYVENEADLQSAKAVLERDAPEHARLRYDIQTRSDRVKILERRLEELGLDGDLHIQQLEDGISLLGPTPPYEKIVKLIKSAEGFNKEFGSRPKLRLVDQDQFLGISTVELDVRAVVLGNKVHIVMQDGESYAQGDTIGNGYRIRKIHRNYIVLEKPDRLASREGSGESDLAYFIVNRR